MDEFDVRQKVEAALQFVRENRDILVPLATAVLPAITISFKKSRTNRKEKGNRMKVWDPATGRHLYLRREMTAREEGEYSYRVSVGERRYDILMDMGLLRNEYR